jgi:hypothetical protein
VPGEQPHVANLVKLNANESSFRPSPLPLEAMRAAAVDMSSGEKHCFKSAANAWVAILNGDENSVGRPISNECKNAQFLYANL